MRDASAHLIGLSGEVSEDGSLVCVRGSPDKTGVVTAIDITGIGASCFEVADPFVLSFQRCYRLSAFDDGAFSGSGIKSLCVPASVRVIGCSCFQDCRELSFISF